MSVGNPTREITTAAIRLAKFAAERSQELAGEIQSDCHDIANGETANARAVAAATESKLDSLRSLIEALGDTVADLADGREIYSEADSEIEQITIDLLDAVKFRVSVDSDYGADADGNRGIRVETAELVSETVTVSGFDDVVPKSARGTWRSDGMCSTSLDLIFRLNSYYAPNDTAVYRVDEE